MSLTLRLTEKAPNCILFSLIDFKLAVYVPRFFQMEPARADIPYLPDPNYFLQ
jgi:hypothetical protein